MILPFDDNCSNTRVLERGCSHQPTHPRAYNQTGQGIGHFSHSTQVSNNAKNGCENESRAFVLDLKRLAKFRDGDTVISLLSKAVSQSKGRLFLAMDNVGMPGFLFEVAGP